MPDKNMLDLLMAVVIVFAGAHAFKAVASILADIPRLSAVKRMWKRIDANQTKHIEMETAKRVMRLSEPLEDHVIKTDNNAIIQAMSQFKYAVNNEYGLRK